MQTHLYIKVYCRQIISNINTYTTWQQKGMSKKINRGFQSLGKSPQMKQQLHEAAEYRRRGRYMEAVNCYRKCLKMLPNDSHTQLLLAESLEELGSSYHNQGRSDLALPPLQASATLSPQRLSIHISLGLACKGVDQLLQATEHYRRALDIDPSNITALCNLGIAYRALEKVSEAEDCFRQALDKQPGSIEANACLADLQEWQGNIDEAHTLLKPFQESDSLNVAIVFATTCQRLHREEEALSIVQRCLERQDITPRERAQLLFKLGDLNDGLSFFDDAFENYRKANLLSAQPFDTSYWIQETDRVMATFGKTTEARFPRPNLHSELPVFIVGMPRSGTSLVEQILASHSQIYAAGERPDLGKLAAATPSSLKQEWLDQAAELYLKRLQALAPEATYITDKQPTNFLYLWLVSLAFPGARVIHCLRDPLDTCLSCYFQNFNSRQPFAGNLHYLEVVYKQYTRLMDHWQKVLNLKLFPVVYEEIVADPEKVSRNLLDFLALKWEPDCLAFYQNKRLVNTASYDQVRQPIYDRSVGRARRDYGHHIKNLIHSLEKS
jgi:tetratricopeptide (TPR) repeat protein